MRSLLSLALVYCAAASAARPTAALSVQVTDAMGRGGFEDLRCLLQSESLGVLEERTGSCEFSAVPMGLYSLTVETSGFKPHRQVVSVFQNSVFVRVILQIGDIADSIDFLHSFNRVAGHVVGDFESRSLTVRLIPLFGNSGRIQDAAIDGSGWFELAGMDNGSYLLLVIQEERDGSPRVIETKQLQIVSRNTSVEIELVAVEQANEDK
ncbi:MAG: hypothetical protein H6509_05750 [Bryobacterales bacterium]|nr:hypothetical protein [Bryobacterales bacterium]